MIADSKIVDPRTGEVIAFPSDRLDDEVLYRLDRLGVDEHYQVLIDEIWRDMECGLISPVVAELRIFRLMIRAGWRIAGSISYRGH